MEKPRLIASDVDGTLVAGPAPISERTVDVVGRAVDDGVPVVLVTGRPPRWIPEIAEQLGLSGYAVCANGAVLYDIGDDAVLDVHGLIGPALLDEIAAALTTALPGCFLGAERIGTRAEDAGVAHFLVEHGYHSPWGDVDGARTDRAEVLREAAVKLLVRQVGMSSGEMAEAARAVLGGSVAVTYSSGGGLIEVAAVGVTKATGIAEVAARLDVPADETIAFGDMPNDVEMLRWAGHGVAMANAHPDVLLAADEVTAANHEDGVAQVLERWF